MSDQEDDLFAVTYTSTQLPQLDGDVTKLDQLLTAFKARYAHYKKKLRTLEEGEKNSKNHNNSNSEGNPESILASENNAGIGSDNVRVSYSGLNFIKDGEQVSGVFPGVASILQNSSQNSGKNPMMSISAGAEKPPLYWEERELYVVVEEICTHLNGGVNYRVLCNRYRRAMDCVLALLKEDMALIQTVEIYPQGAFDTTVTKLKQLLQESITLLAEANVEVPQQLRDLTMVSPENVVKPVSAKSVVTLEEYSPRGSLHHPTRRQTMPGSSVVLDTEPLILNGENRGNAAIEQILNSTGSNFVPNGDDPSQVNPEPITTHHHPEAKAVLGFNTNTKSSSSASYPPRIPAHPRTDSLKSDSTSGFTNVRSRRQSAIEMNPLVDFKSYDDTSLTNSVRRALENAAPHPPAEPKIPSSPNRCDNPRIPQASREVTPKPAAGADCSPSNLDIQTDSGNDAACTPLSAAVQTDEKIAEIMKKLINPTESASSNQIIDVDVDVSDSVKKESVRSEENDQRENETQTPSVNGNVTYNRTSVDLEEQPVVRLEGRERVKKLEELYGEGYHLEGLQLLLDVLGVVYKQEYDQGDRNTQEGAFIDFKKDFQGRVMPAFDHNSRSFLLSTSDTTPLRSAYLMECLASRVKPNNFLLETFQKFPEREIDFLALHTDPIKDTGIVPLMAVLSKLYRLKTLDLHQSGITDEGIDAIAEGVHYHPSLETIILSNNEITDASVPQLLSIIHTVPKLAQLALYGCPLSPEARSLLSNEVKFPNVHVVYTPHRSKKRNSSVTSYRAESAPPYAQGFAASAPAAELFSAAAAGGPSLPHIGTHTPVRPLSGKTAPRRPNSSSRKKTIPPPNKRFLSVGKKKKK